MIPVTKPVDITTRETVEFVVTHARSRSRILEIGCGEGHVAEQLVAAGHRVLAIDADPVAIEKARPRGLSAEVASWPSFACPAVDVVLFTRSLHHIHELSAAISAVRRVLAPGGSLLVEDFAFHSATRSTIEWLVGRLRSDNGAALVRGDVEDLVVRLRDADDAEAAWHHSHDRDLHPFETMREAIERELTIAHVGEVAYLYRYLVPVVPESAEATAWVADIHRDEVALGAAGPIALVGRRIVATLEPVG